MTDVHQASFPGISTSSGKDNLELRAKRYNRQEQYPGVVLTVAEQGSKNGRASIRLEPGDLRGLIDFLESLDLG